MAVHPVLIEGEWRASTGSQTFQAFTPNNREPIPDKYPISPWSELQTALDAAETAFQEMRADWSGKVRADFLDHFANRLQARAEELVEWANRETGLPREPRLAQVELPRTINQLRLAARAVREHTWEWPTIDTKNNIRSMLAPFGPVAIFGPNNFPFAFNACAGGDFAAAIAAGNPVLAKAHPLHPGTSRCLAEEAHQAALEVGLPQAAVQMFYQCDPDNGIKLASHPKLAALAFTGSRRAGLALKQAADAVGKPIVLEMGSINPVVILPGSLEERGPAICEEYVQSVLMGSGQFCTNPGLVFLLTDPASDVFLQAVAKQFQERLPGTLFSEGVEAGMAAAVNLLTENGAVVLAGGQTQLGEMPSPGYGFPNTLLHITGAAFLNNPELFQTEVFGNVALAVEFQTAEQLFAGLHLLSGNLTGTIYSHSGATEDGLYEAVERILRSKVGRLLNDKMPTGVAVSPAMNHGGPFPATNSPFFTAVGIPAAIHRFTARFCYDNVRQDRLPPLLRNVVPFPELIWRFVDGSWVLENTTTLTDSQIVPMTNLQTETEN